MFAFCLVCVIFLFLLGLYYLYIARRFQYWKNKKIPYLPPESSIFGNYKHVALGKITFEEFLRQAYQEATGFKICGLFIFLNPVLLVRDPEIIKNILTVHFDNFTDRSAYLFDPRIFFTQHSYHVNSKGWMKTRKVLQSAFTATKLKSVFEQIKESADKLVKVIEESMGEDGSIEITDLIERYCSNVVIQFLFEKHTKSMKSKLKSEFRKINNNQYGSKYIFRHVITQIWPKLSNLLHITQINPEIENFIDSVIADVSINKNFDDVPCTDFVHLLLEEYNSKCNDVNSYAARFIILLMAGCKPSSTLLNLTLMEIAKHELVQEKIQMEIDFVLENYNYEITSESLYNMAYIDRVISETIRRHPISPLLIRTCTKDYHIPGMEFTIETGTTVIVPLNGLYNDSKYFLKPKEFNPDHFSNAAKYSRSRYCFLPFGEGPRHCIAWRLALLMIKLAIVTLMQHYSLRLSLKMPSPLKFSKSTSTDRKSVV